MTDKLRLLWSPEQIAGWLKHSHPHDENHRVSHETIYRTLFIQARGALKKELLQHLRRTRAMRRSRHHTQKTEIHGQIVGALSISERPASADDRAVPGHWDQRSNEFCAADGKHAVITVGQTTGWLVPGLQTAEVQFYCDDRPAAHADKSAKP